MQTLTVRERCETLPRLLRATYAQAEQRMAYGFLSSNVWRWYRFFWVWCAPRFGGTAGIKHDRAYARLGTAAYERRMLRVRALKDRLFPEAAQ